MAGALSSSFLDATPLGNSLESIFLTGEITPGDEVSYQVCKCIFLYHPLGAKMVVSPLQLALAEPRNLTVTDSPGERCTQAFEQQWEELGADQVIFQTMAMSRVYGIASVAAMIDSIAPGTALDPWNLHEQNIAFNVYDPLNTAGSLVLNQLPLSKDFLQTREIAVQGTQFHRSRAVTVTNEFPVYLAWSSSAFGFVGRSVYQRAFFPLKSYLRTLIVDDMIETKVGVLVAKIKQAGTISNAITKAAAAFKRNVVKEAETGNVINITPDEDVESLNLVNMDNPHQLARRNILENIATAADMPIKLLAQEAFVEGFGEGTEDAKAIANYIERVRTAMAPLHRFFDRICMHRAWTPAFYEGMKKDFPQTYGDMEYKAAFYRWANSFKALWPSMLQEPESEKYHLEDVKLRAVIALIQVFEPILDAENKLALYQWATDNISENRSMFITPLEFDFEALEEHMQDQEQQQQEMQEAQQQGMQNGQEGAQQGGGSMGGLGSMGRAGAMPGGQSGMVKMGKADSMAARFDKAAATLAQVAPEAPSVIPIDKLRKVLHAQEAR